MIDPGVGSSREILVLKTNTDFFFVGPNNGIFPNIFDISEILECINIQNEKYFNHPVSSTFHGRDIMAPVGAYISKNVSVKNFGPNFNFDDLVKLEPISYEFDLKNRCIYCTIQYIDSFGNAITTIPIIGNKIKDSQVTLEEGSKISIIKNQKTNEGLYVSHFSGVPHNSLLFLVGSTNFLEVSVNQGNASERLGLRVGDKVTIKL